MAVKHNVMDITMALIVSSLLLLICPVVWSKPASNVSKLRAAADSAFVGGNIGKAYDLYSQVIALEKNEQNYYKRFRVLLKQRKYARAISDLEAALKIKPDFAQALSQKGKLLKMTGRCKQAQEDLEQAIKLDSSKQTQQEYQQAVRCAEHLFAGEQAQAHGNYQEAHRHLTEAILIASSSETLLLQRATISNAMGNTYDMLEDTRQAVRMDPTNIEALQMRGMAFYQLGDKESLENALNHYREALQYDPEHTGVKKLYRQVRQLTKLQSKGEEAMDQQRYEQAAASFTAAVNIDPTHFQLNKGLLLRLCTCYNHLNKPNEAISECQKLLQIEPSSAKAYAQLAESHILLENFEEALRLYQKAHELDNQDEEIMQGYKRAETALKQSKTKNYYKILGVPRNADVKAIKSAYRKLALKHHPDKVVEDEKEKSRKLFEDIGEAYEVLSNQELRERYDRGEDIKQPQQQQHPFHHQGQPPFFQQGGGGFNFRFNFG